MNYREIIKNITGADPKAREAALRHWNSLAKPLGSLGQLEEHVIRMAGLIGTDEVELKKRVLLVLCADNGVVCRGVSQSGPDVTAAVTTALGAGTSTVNYMARQVGCEVIPVDMGVLDYPGAPGVLDRRIANGTQDITVGPAMTVDQCAAAIEAGIALVREQKAAGANIILLGEMGIANTTTSCAVASALLGEPPAKLTGRGAGLSDAALAKKISAIETALSVNRPDTANAFDVLQKLGGFDIAGLCGVCLGGAYYRVPILLDGLIATVAALCAVRLCPAAADALLASHLSAEPSAALVMQALGLRGVISAGMRLGEGSGAVAALGLLDTALAVYNSGHSFGALGIEAYTPQS